MGWTKENAKTGGAAVPAEKRSFSKDRELAREAGRKGGLKSRPQNRTFYTDRALAVKAGRAGGLASVAARRERGKDVER